MSDTPDIDQAATFDLAKLLRALTVAAPRTDKDGEPVLDKHGRPTRSQRRLKTDEVFAYKVYADHVVLVAVWGAKIFADFDGAEIENPTA